MKAYFGPPKDINVVHNIPDGNYALEPSEDGKQFHWDHCREQFSAKFTDPLTAGFYFSHPDIKGDDVANFLAKFECIIQFDNPVSSFAKTNKDNILWVQVSPFWLSCPMKRSLLTIILRCGMRYDSKQDNFDDALFGEWKDNYARETRQSVIRFLFGFTEFKGIKPLDNFPTSVIKHGWREEFQKLDDSTIRLRLVMPENKTKEKNIVGVESLWV